MNTKMKSESDQPVSEIWRTMLLQVARTSVKTVVGSSVREAALEAGSALTADVIGEVAKELAGEIAGPVLRLLFRIADRTAKRLKVLERKIDTIQRELDLASQRHLITGLRMASEIVVHPEAQGMSGRFLEIYCNTAISELEQARTVAESLYEYRWQLPYIHLAEAWCALEISGSEEFVASRFSDASIILEGEVQALLSDVEQMERDAERARIEALELRQEAPSEIQPPISIPMSGAVYDSSLATYEREIREATYLDGEAGRLTDSAQQVSEDAKALRKFVEMLRLLSKAKWKDT